VKKSLQKPRKRKSCKRTTGEKGTKETGEKIRDQKYVEEISPDVDNEVFDEEDTLQEEFWTPQE